MEIDKQAGMILLARVHYDRPQRLLLCCHDELLESLLHLHLPETQVDCLLDMDLEHFVAERLQESAAAYGCIIDNGLLEQAGWDRILVMTMMLYLRMPSGNLYTIYHCAPDMDLVAYACDIGFNHVECFHEIPGERTLCFGEWGVFNQLVVWLQSFYTAEVRQRLAYLLQRLDFDVLVQESRRELKELCAREGIPGLYMERMIDAAVVHREKVKGLLELG